MGKPEQFEDVAAALKGGDNRQAEIIWRRQSKDQTRRIRALGAHVAEQVTKIADRRSNQVTQEHLDDLKTLAMNLFAGMELDDPIIRAELKKELSEHYDVEAMTDGELALVDPNPPSLKEWVERQPEGSRVRIEWAALAAFKDDIIAAVDDQIAVFGGYYREG